MVGLCQRIGLKTSFLEGSFISLLPKFHQKLIKLAVNGR
jgi:hypothetical protein